MLILASKKRYYASWLTNARRFRHGIVLRPWTRSTGERERENEGECVHVNLGVGQEEHYSAPWIQDVPKAACSTWMEMEVEGPLTSPSSH